MFANVAACALRFWMFYGLRVVVCCMVVLTLLIVLWCILWFVADAVLLVDDGSFVFWFDTVGFAVENRCLILLD